MKHLVNLAAVIAGLVFGAGAFAVESSPERYAEPYPHKPDQDTGMPRLGPKSDYVARPGSAAAVEKQNAEDAGASKGRSGEHRTPPQQPRQAGPSAQPVSSTDSPTPP